VPTGAIFRSPPPPPPGGARPNTPATGAETRIPSQGALVLFFAGILGHPHRVSDNGQFRRALSSSLRGTRLARPVSVADYEQKNNPAFRLTDHGDVQRRAQLHRFRLLRDLLALRSGARGRTLPVMRTPRAHRREEPYLSPVRRRALSVSLRGTLAMLAL